MIEPVGMTELIERKEGYALGPGRTGAVDGHQIGIVERRIFNAQNLRLNDRSLRDQKRQGLLPVITKIHGYLLVRIVC